MPDANPALAYIDEFNDIVFTLNELARADDPDELAKIRRLRDLEERALALQHLNESYGYSALGGIAAARGSLRDLHKYHKQSLQQGANPVLLANYAGSLFLVGEYAQALTLALEAHDMAPGEKKYLSHVIIIAFELGDESAFLSAAQKWEHLTGEQHPLFAEYLELVNEAQELSTCCTTLAAPAVHALYE